MKESRKRALNIWLGYRPNFGESTGMYCCEFIRGVSILRVANFFIVTMIEYSVGARYNQFNSLLGCVGSHSNSMASDPCPLFRYALTSLDT